MSKLASLKNAQTLHDVAYLLGETPSMLAFTLYKLTSPQKYKTFSVPKKGGGERVIHAPQGKLKEIQRKLADVLYACQAEILAENPRRPLSHGFRKSQSIITNAQLHRNQRYVLNLDLADFFPTFNFGRVRGFFLKDKNFLLSEKVATVLAQIACFDSALPQGSPCSPIIADMIAHILDMRLVSLAKKQRVTYSRYADDLTFSTSQKKFPESLAKGGSNPDDLWTLGSQLTKEIEKTGFQINPAKTRMQIKTSRQMVTGLTVNEKVNIPQDYWRGLRSMSHALYKTGAYHLPKIKNTNQDIAPELITSVLPLAGMYSHVYRVKKESGRRPDEHRKDLVFGYKDHQTFWFYKYFIALELPLIITEGKTDSVYLRNAIRHLSQFQPTLGIKQTDNSFKYNLSFFNYDNTASRILHITGGASHLVALIANYRSHLKRYTHKPLTAPVIILIDNDTALNKGFIKMLENQYSIKVGLSTKESFYHITDNLYLVKTPELGVTGTSCIEDFFDESIKSQKLDGKIFHSEKKGFDPTQHIGKAAFAKKVVAPNAINIDWKNFSSLLERMEAVIENYKKPSFELIKA